MDPLLNTNINQIYYDISHPAGYSSINKLTAAMKHKMNKSEVQKWLQSQETYTLHKQVQRKIPRNKYILSNLNDLWQVDLSDMRTYAQYNDGFKYILCVIDVFSKYAFARIMKKKNSETVKTCFESIFTEANTTPTHIQSDKGTEFVSKDVRMYLKNKNVNYYTTNNPDIKASIVERFQRTLKMKMWRYFTHKNTYRYIDILQDLLYSYNHSHHSSIKMRPCDVNSSNIMTVWNNLYGKYLDTQNISPVHKFKVGDYVRITKYKHIFQKGYETNWSDEIFIITSIINRKPMLVYTLKDLHGEVIEGTFYEKELQKVMYDPHHQEHKIDKILSTRYSGIRKEAFVKWKGYPNKFNSWIKVSELKNIQ